MKDPLNPRTLKGRLVLWFHIILLSFHGYFYTFLTISPPAQMPLKGWVESRLFPLYSSKIGSSPSFSEAAERLLEPSPNKEIIDSKENGRSTAERKE
ncbi:hypothetical protein TNCT_301451 [Trichonephila clavata]|uniref:Uncharacterized protein n=1 Tax=Trichonephila clavata TaxID=2740835 RepID=A0A8X6H9Z4_TRICU|nr:hypothetical protein TNCT_301451 [Trichonephila clavata]